MPSTDPYPRRQRAARAARAAQLPRGRAAACRVAALLLALQALPDPGLAQDGRSVAPDAETPATTLVLPGDAYEDRERVQRLVGARAAEGVLLRTPSARFARRVDTADGALRVGVLAPRIRTVWNSDLPFSLNEGTLWAGRGLNLAVLAGVSAEWGPVSLIFAPELAYQANREFQIFPYPGADRSTFSSPWHVGPAPLDLPLRFGDEPFVRFGPGQSSLAVRAGPVRFGVATENQWWGPGIRNGLLLSSNAPGFPHAFVQTYRPLATRLGEFEVRWMVGTLTESLYFDTIAANDLRSISGAAAVFRPAWQPNLSVGVARTVISPSGTLDVLPGRALDAFRSSTPHWEVGDSLPGAAPGPRAREQIFAAFGHWAFPADGFELYAEWARMRLPSSLRDLVVAPNHTQGYTLGAQWARPLHSSGLLRLQGEVTVLEMSSTYRQREVPTFYLSARIPQGYTHRGQVIGAAIGPGASSQWLAADYFAPRWSAGVFGGRIRWENDTFYRTTYEGRRRSFASHDVSLFGGLRSTIRLPVVDLGAELTVARRYNYLFQNPGTFSPDDEGVVDVGNRTLKLWLAPRLSR